MQGEGGGKVKQKGEREKRKKEIFLRYFISPYRKGVKQESLRFIMCFISALESVSCKGRGGRSVAKWRAKCVAPESKKKSLYSSRTQVKSNWMPAAVLYTLTCITYTSALRTIRRDGHPSHGSPTLTLLMRFCIPRPTRAQRHLGLVSAFRTSIHELLGK